MTDRSGDFKTDDPQAWGMIQWEGFGKRGGSTSREEKQKGEERNSAHIAGRLTEVAQHLMPERMVQVVNLKVHISTNVQSCQASEFDDR